MKEIRGLFFLMLAGFLSCNENTTGPSTGGNTPAVANGVYILSEGRFGYDEASLSLYDINRDTVYHDVFENANGGMHLGDVGDDIKIGGDKLYVLIRRISKSSTSLTTKPFNPHHSSIQIRMIFSFTLHETEPILQDCSRAQFSQSISERCNRSIQPASVRIHKGCFSLMTISLFAIPATDRTGLFRLSMLSAVP